MAGKKIPYEENHRDINGYLEKQCNRCEEWFPTTLEYFYKNTKSPDGLFPYCKECAIKSTNKNIQKNHAQYLNSYKKYREKNREIVRKRKRDWYALNKEYAYEYTKNYQQTNPEKCNGYTKERKHKNHKISKKEWEDCKSYFNYCCAYCNISEEEAKEVYKQCLHKEHAEHEGENNLSNCIPACKSCNSQKWEFNLEDWYMLNNPIFKQERLDKINKWLNEDYKKYVDNSNKVEL